MKNLEVVKSPDEAFAIGLIYTSPDLDENETLSSATVTITGDEETITLLAVGNPILENGNKVSQKISGGTANQEYKVIFQVVTSVGYTYEDYIYVKVRSN